MTKILFICSGNVGRSQIAEAYYNYYSHSSDAFSAGTDPTTPSRYTHPTKEIIQVMIEEGIDVSNQVVKTLEEKMLEGINSIYIMCKKEQCPDYLVNSTKVNFWNIEDPYKMDVIGTKKIRDQIKIMVKKII